MTHELLMIVAIVSFIIGVLYGRMAGNMSWRSRILKICIGIPHPTICDVVGVEKLTGVVYEDEPVYVVTESVLMETWVHKIQCAPNIINHLTAQMRECTTKVELTDEEHDEEIAVVTEHNDTTHIR